MKNEKETKYAKVLCTGGCFSASFEFLEYLIGYTRSKCNTNPIQESPGLRNSGNPKLGFIFTLDYTFSHNVTSANLFANGCNKF